MCFAHNKNTQWHYDKADYTRIGEVFWNKVKTLEDLEVLISKYRTEYNTAVKNAAYEQYNLKNLSISELKNLLQKQIDRLCESAGIAHLVEAASYVAEKKLVDEYKIDTQNIKASDLSFIKKAAIFAHMLVESEKNDETILDEFKKKYAWIQSSYLGRNEITISEIRKLAERHDETQVSLPSNNFVGIISRMFSWQDERKGNILESIYYSEPVLFALADALGLSHEAIVFLLPEEISKIENKEFQKGLVERTNVFVDYATHDSSRATFVGSEAQKFIDDFSMAIEHKDEIKGAVAYPGNVTGVVRVCLSMQSIESFKEGEILVASMTRPEYVPAMKKAIAFITDEGGITCHAAIIAREMKKPCVIGTKNATKILKDGDVVELDSVNGVIKIISRASEHIDEEYFKDTALLASRPQTVQRDELCYVLIQNYKDLSPKIITAPLEGKNRSLNLGKKFTENINKKYFSDLNSEKGFSEYVSRYKKLQKELSKIASKNEKTRKKKEEILKTIERFIEGVAKLADYIWSPFLVETVFDKKLHEMLQNVYPEKAEYYYGIFTSPTELHEYQKIRMALCEAVIKNKNTAKIAQKLADEYSWHGEYSYIEDLLDKEHFIHEINTLTVLAAKNEYERIVDGINHNKKEFTKALKEIKDPTILLYGKIVNKYVFLRTDRVDELKKMQKSMRVCFDYIAEFLTHDSGVLWTRKNVANLLNEEIIGYLKQGVLLDFDFVNARAENYIYARDIKKTQMITNPDQIAKIVSLVVESKDSNTMSGKIAFKGIATGPVVMVFGKNDLHKVTHDSILVARTTMVDYTPAMERAMAFVTEEGGVTSHAAIVARELKKPCIVGVKNVTKLLKDGDIVEVDANTGVVKILNSNENILSKKNIDGNFLTQNDIKPPFIYKGFHALFYPIDFVQLCWNKWGDYSGYYYKAHITAFHDSYWDLYYLPQEFTKLRNHYFGKLKEDKNFLQKHVADWSDACHKLEIIIKSFEQNFNSDFEAFKQIYIEAIDMYVYEYGLSAPAQEACGFQPEQWITPKIEAYAKKYGLDFQDTFSLLTAPTVNSFITEEEIGLYDIILHSAEVDTYAFDELVSIHAHNYFWIKNNYAETNVLDKDYFLERIEELKKEDMKHLKDRYEEMISYPHIKNEEKKEIFKQYPPDEELALYTNVNETFAYMQDVRKSFVLKMNYYHQVFLERVASEYERNMQDLYLYGYNELIQAIDGGIWIDANEISNRKKMIVAIETKTEKNIFSGAMAIELYKQLQSTEAVSNTIKGIVAQKGIARGPAKIVLKTHHILKVQKGDIMVSSMTRPEMTSAMQKAVAFVTDEGGITCHAAIIAREMKKPCVIGTKNATKVIHDGDIIEVDANTGIITIIG